LERAGQRRRVRKVREKIRKKTPVVSNKKKLLFILSCYSTSSFMPITTMPTHCIVPKYNYFFKILGLAELVIRKLKSIEDLN